MKDELQVILGASGAIGTNLAAELPAYTNQIRLVSRRPEKINLSSDELFPADLLDAREARLAVKDASVVYLCVGLEYKFKTWQQKWPQIMANVIAACKDSGAKLVFFDNIYMYSEKAMGNINENSPVAPPSKKGKIRAEIVQMLLDEITGRKLTALIARSADFYGPQVKNSLLYQMVINPLKEGKRANWMGDPGCRHSFTFVPDAAKATALLGNTPEAYNQVWHLPTADNPPTGEGWIEAIAAEMKVEPKYWKLSATMIKLLGVFMPVMREMPEMMYQYQQDYIFNSQKFQKKFALEPTPYSSGIKATVAAEEKEEVK